MSAVKTGHIVFIDPYMAGGGAQRVAVELSRYFVQHGYRFTVCITKENRLAYDLPEGVELVLACNEGRNDAVGQTFAIRRIAKRFPRAKFLSFMPNQNLMTIAACVGLPNDVYVSVRNVPAEDFNGNRTLGYIRNRAYVRAAGVIFQLQSQKISFPRYIQERGRVIPNPLSPLLPEACHGARRNVITTSGRLVEQKNHEMTLRAFSLLHKVRPSLRLEIFGIGPREESLKQLAESLGIEGCVDFKGFSKQAVEAICSSRAFVLSSKFEGMPNALIESMAMGVPSVATRCGGGGAEEFITDGVNGRLVEIDDDKALANALLRILDDEGYANELSRNAIKVRELLSADRVGGQWESFIFKKPGGDGI